MSNFDAVMRSYDRTVNVISATVAGYGVLAVLATIAAAMGAINGTFIPALVAPAIAGAGIPVASAVMRRENRRHEAVCRGMAQDTS